MVNPISGVTNTAAQQNASRINDRLQSAISSLVTGTRNNRAGDDIASLSIATQLQSQLSGLREVSNNVAQSTSQLQVADGGAEQIGNLVQELRELAVQAQSPTLNQSTRDTLNEQFQQLVQEIDRTAASTAFNGNNLLDGSVSGDNSVSIGEAFGQEAGEGVRLEIASLTSETLFSGQSLDILSADGAAQALEALDVALGSVTQTRAEIGSFTQSLGFIAANINSAIANQEAARAVLADADIAEQSTLFSLLNTQRDANLALTAQTNRLPESLLNLLE